MGAGIAQVVAASGRQVLLHDPFPGAVERGLAGMRTSLEKLEAKGGPPAADVLARVTESVELAAADLMIEAIVEDADGEGSSSSGRPTRRSRPTRSSPPTRRRSRSRRSPPPPPGPTA